MRLEWLCAAVFVAFGIQGTPQSADLLNLNAGTAANRTETAHLTVATSVRGGAVAPGTRVSLVVDVTPKPRMHVYAPGQPDVIPISVSIEADEAFKGHRATYPKPEKYFFDPLKETQLVYSRPFRIVQDVTVASTVRERARTTGTLTIAGTLRYQACDDKVCYTPQQIPVSWAIPLEPPDRQK